jgi:hypothetical protein
LAIAQESGNKDVHKTKKCKKEKHFQTPSSQAVLRIRIRIHMFLGLLDPDPDPIVRGMDTDPDPSIIKPK